MYNNENTVHFVKGIFHAIDPLNVSEYGADEYESYAREFVQFWRSKHPNKPYPEEVKEWLLSKYEGYSFCNPENVSRLCLQLSRV